MSTAIDVTKYFRSAPTPVPGHYWKVEIEEKTAGNWWCEAGDYELKLYLWQRGFKVAIKATSGRYIKPELSHDNVGTLLAGMSKEIATLMSLTPKPRKRFYLCHSSYAFMGRGKWRTTVKHYEHKRADNLELEYRLNEVDREDLEYDFTCLLDKATFEPTLPRFVTG